MAEQGPTLPLVKEETARLKWFEAFMCGRMELEQQTISGLRALLEGAPLLPECKLSWNCTLERILDGTRDELHNRMEGLERLKDQMQAVGMSIAKTEMRIRDLNFEFEKLKSTDNVDSAQAATATSHKDWHNIKSVDISRKKSLSGLFSAVQAQKESLEVANKKRLKAHEAFQKYHKQDLTYRRMVHQQRQNQEQFLNSIPHRVQEYGTKYWTAVCDIAKMMESFANHLRDISSTCNSSGSALWASAKSIKPIIDANCHMEAIEFAYHRSPTRFLPIYYQNPGSKSASPNGQAILFGCPLELCTVGELKKVPPVLEYLLDSVPYYWCTQVSDIYQVMNAGSLVNGLEQGTTNSLHCKVEECWPFVNELEQAWTGVEESDRALISDLVLQGHLRLLIMAYFMTLPKPLLSCDDIVEVQDSSYQSASLIWNTWSKDPIKATVLRAILSCQTKLPYYYFGWDMSVALGQNWESSKVKNLLFILNRYPDVWRSPVSRDQEET